jgi:hypothetical protein
MPGLIGKRTFPSSSVRLVIVSPAAVATEIATSGSGSNPQSARTDTGIRGQRMWDNVVTYTRAVPSPAGAVGIVSAFVPGVVS